MKRRKFITDASLYSTTMSLVMSGSKVGILPQSPLLRAMNMATDKVLVLVQLQGGNDGLNTLVPLDHYAQLERHRGNLLPREDKLLNLDGHAIGMHPALGGIKRLFEEGKLSVVHGVGYPNQNRSHFRSMDIWSSGSDANAYDTRGWLGKYLETLHNDYPEGYPGVTNPDPIAITMGAIVSETCQGRAANFGISVNDPFGLSPLVTGVAGVTPDNFYGQELDFVREEIEKTNAYTEAITRAATLGQSKVDYPTSPFASQLSNVATLISGGLETSIYVCSIGGFDTHARQVEKGDALTGLHAELLSELDAAIAAFQEDLRELGLEDRVLGMTFSEFGRQIRSNESLGTDHGSAAPLFLFGACVQSGFYGQIPEILDEVAPQEGVALQTDFRDVYGTVLQQWFGVQEDAVRKFLYNEFMPLPLLGNCQSTAVSKSIGKVDFTVFPNPFTEYFQVTIDGDQSKGQLSVFDAQGAEISTVLLEKLRAGSHPVTIDLSHYPDGNYFVHYKSSAGQATKSAVKISSN
ncbi:MAG: DUF1501 domain-containing protein [Saprospiraceae bacterium]|nr:DUF1501 domain-containing protein [Saprospiraceae bacterium]